MNLKYRHSYLLLSVICFLLAGCYETVRNTPLTGFSQNASTIDFEKEGKEFYAPKPTEWLTDETKNEYYFESIYKGSEEKLFAAIKYALRIWNYRIAFSSMENKCMIGKRGMGMNELNSITAVYYKFEPSRLRVYILTIIKQDSHGGFRENRSMKVGKSIVNQMFKE